MIRRLLAVSTLLASVAALAVPAAAFAADNSANVTLDGFVTGACSMGSFGAISSTINLGALNNATDQLATISGKFTQISGSWCNGPSTISVVGTPVVATDFSGAPPTGFTKAVNYTVQAVGWTSPSGGPSFTTTAAQDGTGSTAAPTTATETAPQAATISVLVGAFATPSAADRLVASPNYTGAITVTLTATS
jgi:hypothetical protein